ncbi:MAG TPA: DUF2911 domain-containing protein [Saprospiraceae bacterium]|nr:DUF2911 domain-containing protein [Saprospiraceae bacterium]
MKSAYITLFSFIVLMGLSTIAQGQEDKSKRPSPPAEIRGTIDSTDIAIYYSSPAVKGRLIWGELVPYGKVWRTGANEATVFETSKELKVDGKTLAPGKYGLFTIPGEKEWTIILNSVWDQWGAFKYDNSKDVLRFTVPVQKSTKFNERLKFDIVSNDVILYWENLMVRFEVN